MSSIAKGFAVQELHDYLVLNNLTNHLIDIGGEVIINGTNGSNPWVVGIQDPRNQSEKPIFLVSNDKSNFLAIATSGEYRNIRFDGDDLITHTFNPFTKKSISGNLESITIVSQNSATLADAYATAVNVMGFEKGIEFVNSNDIAALFIVSDEGELKLIKSQKWYDLGL
jgi:thiamine biosynthesis lipoprotein